MRIAILLSTCLTLALVASPMCAGSTEVKPPTSPEKEGLPDRDPELARRLVAEGALLLDVRTPEEFRSRHIEGAVNVPLDELEALTGDRTRPIVVYCRSGRRSGIAKEKLVNAGYERVTNLGGIDDWYK